MKRFLFIAIIFFATNLIASAQNTKTKSKKLKTPTARVAVQAPIAIKLEEAIAAAQPIITTSTNGNVNWTDQYVEAKGSSVIDSERFKNSAQANAMAARGAVVVAQRNLLEIINGVQVTGTTTVEDMITTSDVISTKVEGVIKGARIIGEPIIKNGMIEITMRVPLYETGGLAPAVYEGIPQSQKPVTEVKPIENDKPVSVSQTATDEESKKLVFNLNGQKFDPSLFPIIQDKDGKTLLDLSKVYDPKSGKFPKYLQLAKDVMKGVGFDKGADVVDVISTSGGKITLSDIGKNKINWQKIGKTAATIGKFLLLLI